MMQLMKKSFLVQQSFHLLIKVRVNALRTVEDVILRLSFLLCLCRRYFAFVG